VSCNTKLEKQIQEVSNLVSFTFLTDFFHDDFPRLLDDYMVYYDVR